MPAPRRRAKPAAPSSSWAKGTELVGLTLELQPHQDLLLSPQYTTELHSWFLDQVRRLDFSLSTALHDDPSEKAFTISGLDGPIQSQGRSLLLPAQQPYRWTVTALNAPVVTWMQQWLPALPPEMALRSGSFQILGWQLAHPPTTYAQLLQLPLPDPVTLNLTFSSPTSFRHKGNHLPLPLPENIFHSYLRRWNNFSGQAIDPDSFLEWVDGFVVVLRHQVQSSKVAAGKHGSVTGFTGSVQLGLSAGANQRPEFIQAFLTLGNLAPYCGTGHKTTFGLGQTRLGWSADSIAPPPLQAQLADRIADLTTQFTAQRKRTGGDRATQTATTWATILARRELGESLQAIAQDLEMPYETVKTYAKLARQAGRSRKDSAGSDVPAI